MCHTHLQPPNWYLCCAAVTLAYQQYIAAPAHFCQVSLIGSSLQQVVHVLDGLYARQASDLSCFDELRDTIACLIADTNIPHLPSRGQQQQQQQQSHQHQQQQLCTSGCTSVCTSACTSVCRTHNGLAGDVPLSQCLHKPCSAGLWTVT
jgi:hypothetical protein